MKTRLPLQRHPWLSWLLYMAVTGALYFTASHWSLYQPFVVRPSDLDFYIPFWPSAAYIYITYFLLIPALILFSRRQPGFSRVYATTLLCGLLNAFVFLLFPSSLDSIPQAPAQSLLLWIQAMDSTRSVIPSGHVALPFCITFAAMRISRADPTTRVWQRLSIIYLIWAMLISASTVLTGQHYLVDVFAGFLFAFMIAFRPGLDWIRTLAMPTVGALLFEWLIILSTLWITMRWWSWPLAFLATIIVSSRQHALLVLYHDAVHFLISPNRRLNDFLINLLVGVPLLLPVHMYRALHLSHHKDLGTKYDPERVLLYRNQSWNYRALPTRRLLGQLLGDLFLVNSLQMVWFFILEKGKKESHLRLEKTRFYAELPLMFMIFWSAVVFLLFRMPEAVAALLIWFIAYFTFTQLFQKLRSFAEHTTAEDDLALACSWSPGLLGRIFLWPYNINYHREHHKYAGIPWFRLPLAFESVEQRKGTDLVRHLWRSQ